MEDQADFDITESLKLYLSDPTTIPTPEADSSLTDCEQDPESLTNALVNNVLNKVIDAVAVNAEAIAQPFNFDSLQFLLKCAPTTCRQIYISPSNHDVFSSSRNASLLSASTLGKVLDLIVCGLSVEADLAHNDLEVECSEGFGRHKQLLEMFAFLLQWTVAAVETKAAEKPASTTGTAARARGGKGAKAKQGGKDTWDSAAQMQMALDVMSKVLKLRLARIFTTTSERDTFVGLFTRAVYLVLESEARTKSTPIRMHSFKVLCVATKHHGHAHGKLKNIRGFRHD